MSIPINQCLMVKAAHGDKQAYESLRRALIANAECGHFSVFPCSHIPKCDATQAEIDELDKRIRNDFQAEIKDDKSGQPGEKG